MRFALISLVILMLVCAQRAVGQKPQYQPLTAKVDIKAIDQELSALPDEKQLFRIATEIKPKDTYLVKIGPTSQGGKKVADGYEYYLYLKRPLLPFPLSMVENLYSMVVVARYVSEDREKMRSLMYGKSKETGNWKVVGEYSGHGRYGIEVDTTIDQLKVNLRKRMIETKVGPLIEQWGQEFKVAVRTQDEVAVLACFAKPVRVSLPPLIKMVTETRYEIEIQEYSTQKCWIDFALKDNGKTVKIVTVELAVADGEVNGISLKVKPSLRQTSLLHRSP